MGSRTSILRIQIYETAMPPLLMAMAGSTLLELLPTNSTLASYVWLISGVNFTCQLNWAKETQILSKTVFLSLSVRVFLKEINIWVGRLSKEDPSSLTQIGILQSDEDQREQKGGRRAKLFSISAVLSWLAGFFFPLTFIYLATPGLSWGTQNL